MIDGNESMLKHLLYISLTLLLLCSCGSREGQRMLDRAEAAMNENPSNAIAILDSIPDDGLSRNQRMRTRLLRAQAMNKAYVAMDTIRDMEEVLDYYQSWYSSKEDEQVALYMMGCVYRDRHDAPTALRYYKDAVSLADTTRMDCDWHTLSRIYGQIASLYHEQRSPRLELEAERKAVHTALKAKDTIAAINYYEHIAGAYYILGKKDSALFIVESAISHYLRIQYLAKAAAEMGVAADFYITKKNYHRADSLMIQYETHSGFFNDKGEITPGREAYYYTKGRYYEGIEKIDSALFFYRKLLQFPEDIEVIESGYKGLMDVYHKLGVADSVIKYASLYAQANDSVNIIHSAEEITRMQALYNYNNYRIQAERQQKNAEKNFWIAWLLALLLIIFLLLAYATYTRLKRQQEQERARERELFRRLSELENEMTINEIHSTEQELAQSKIVWRFEELSRSSTVPSLQEWKELHSLLKGSFPEFYNKLQNCEPPLRTEEMDICLLIRLHFKSKQIKNLTGLSLSNISVTRKRLLQKVFHIENGGAKDFDKRIREL